MSSKNKELMSAFLTQMKLGSIMNKRKHDGENYSRRFFLHEHEQFMSYHESDKLFEQPRRYYIHKMDEVRTGLHTRTFDRLVRHKIVEESDGQRAFSVFYNNYREELHLVANDEDTRNIWVKGLRYLMVSHAKKRQRHVFTETNWILNHFYLADKDESGTLTKKECRKLLTDSLNAQVSPDVFETFFKEADKTGEGLLTSDEFLDFFRVLTRRKDLYELMRKYVKNGDDQSMDTISMNVDELLYFLHNVQNQTIIVDQSLHSITTREQVLDLINEFETDIKLRENGQLSLSGFRHLLLADEFSLMKPMCSHHIYQDMTRPLSDYYINTSHNTYLFYNQISGDSNPEAYNRALLLGCRAVELDCYDGDKGRPIVKHGYTLIKPCLFESIIRFMEPNLFKTSPYPVILDIENHCSLEQQHEMARILQKILGDRLITEPLASKDSSVLPSPEDLKYKVLVRGVKVPSSITVSKLLKKEIDDDFLLNPQSKVIDHSLADLFVYLQNVSYLEYERAKNDYTGFHSPNLAEKLFDRVARIDPLGLIKQTTKSSLRMYPDGLRQNSSNPNPINPWNFGIQMVALNYQSDDSMIALNYGKFLDNGRCGYVLKPQYLIDVHETHFNPFDYATKPSGIPKNINEHPQRLIITIISGQFLPRANETTTDVPDPYVIVSTHGISCDHQSHKTKVIQNNGFDPTWKETFEFEIQFPQMCLVRFDVYDYDRFTRDDRLACFCLPMLTMQTGYRHIHLRGKHNSLTYSTLFIHVAMENK